MLARGNKLGLIILYTLFITFLFGAFYPAIAQARSLEMDKLAIDAELLPDGSMQVTEHITVTFHGSYNGYFVSIPRIMPRLRTSWYLKTGAPTSLTPNRVMGLRVPIWLNRKATYLPLTGVLMPVMNNVPLTLVTGLIT